MAQHNNSGIKTFTAGEALAAFRRVKLSAASGTQVEYADAGETGIGTTEEAAASGDGVAVRLWNAPGTRKVECNETLSAGDECYGDDDGKFSNDVSGEKLVVILQAATNGAVVEAVKYEA